MIEGVEARSSRRREGERLHFQEALVPQKTHDEIHILLGAKVRYIYDICSQLA